MIYLSYGVDLHIVLGITFSGILSLPCNIRRQWAYSVLMYGITMHAFYLANGIFAAPRLFVIVLKYGSLLNSGSEQDRNRIGTGIVPCCFFFCAVVRMKYGADVSIFSRKNRKCEMRF